MLELWQTLSDDQIALLGCAGALVVAGTVMSLSYYIGRARIASPLRLANVESPIAARTRGLEIAAADPLDRQDREAA